MSTDPHSKRGGVSRFVRRVGSTAKTGFALVGVATALTLYNEYLNRQLALPNDDNDESKKKKQVLVIPFHRLQLMDQKKTDLRSQFQSFSAGKDRHERIKMEVRELVDLIHEAAADPNIVALYGYFGHGSGISQTGWADLEEVRNALRVFRESHRRHLEPNIHYEMQVIPRIESKPLYCYSDTMESLGDPANKEYYLASIFTHVHLQQKGALNLWGLIAQNFFLRDCLQKYGIGLHVFKHGEYKNAPNMFTHQALNRPHREATVSLLQDINASVCEDMARARSAGLLTSWLQQNQQYNPKKDRNLWQRIHEAGTFPALTAWQAGLVDYLPRRDPLPDLLRCNKKKNKTGEGEQKEEEEAKKEDETAGDATKDKDILDDWDRHETDFDRFKATESISLSEYAKQSRKKKAAVARYQRWLQHDMGQLVENGLSRLGLMMQPPSEGAVSEKPKLEKVALLYTNGESGIGDAVARKLVHSIREIRDDKDVKAVVLRVSSPGGAITPCETIRQELKSLKVPVIVSFGNVSASGGYYISSAADRVFASGKTITGSIGVFGIRVDLSELAKQYGVSVDHVTTGDLAGTYSPFYPMSSKMSKLMGDSIDRAYVQFKDIVAEGRNLQDVEALARGRVWTGRQAKDNGLVDELGGLHRAIAYAQREYTSSGEASQVVVWPQKKSTWKALAEAVGKGDEQLLWSTVAEWARGMKMLEEEDDTRQTTTVVDWILKSSFKGAPNNGVMLTADENTAIRCLLNEMSDSPVPDDSFPPSFWE